MSNAVFPTLIGQGWSVTKSPKFSTRIQRSVSGRELRLADMPDPIWTWTLTFNYLPPADLQALLGFFLSRQGSYDTFLYGDPTDNTVTGQQIGTGDGSTTTFQLTRQLGDFDEPIIAPNIISDISVNGVAIPNGSGAGYWTLGANGRITIYTAPASGAVITASFTFYFVVRLADDSGDFENFMQNLWQLKQLRFQSVLP